MHVLRPLAVFALALVSAGCLAPDYELELVPNVATRMSHQEAARLALAQAAAWEADAISAGLPVQGPVRVIAVQLVPTGEQAGADPRILGRVIPGPVWIVKIEGTCFYPGSQFERPSVSSRCVLAFEDATGILYGGGST